MYDQDISSVGVYLFRELASLGGLKIYNKKVLDKMISKAYLSSVIL